MPECAFTASIALVSSNSMRAIGIPNWTAAMTVATAVSTVGKRHTAAAIVSGMPNSFRVTSTITPSVPSEPMNNRVRSYPADDLRARPPVEISEPSGSTTFIDSTRSRIVPYLTALVPEARVAAIPPIVASAPGSVGKNSPSRASTFSSSRRDTPGSTVQSRSSALTLRIRFIAVMSMQTPPVTAWIWPSSDVPAPKGITGTSKRSHSRTIF